MRSYSTGHSGNLSTCSCKVKVVKRTKKDGIAKGASPGLGQPQSWVPMTDRCGRMGARPVSGLWSFHSEIHPCLHLLICPVRRRSRIGLDAQQHAIIFSTELIFRLDTVCPFVQYKEACVNFCRFYKVNEVFLKASCEAKPFLKPE